MGSIKTLSILFCISLFAAIAWADAPGEAQFIRVLRENGSPKALQTSIVTFKDSKTNGATIDLVVAVHVGELDYFKQLNTVFQEYDAVLYELVAPRDHDVAVLQRQEEPNPLSTVQRGITQALGLHFQLDAINYGAKNFVHADLSPKEFMQSMSRRGESATSMLIRMLAASLEQQKKSNPLESFAAIGLLLESDPQRKALKLKRILADQTEDMDLLVKSINGDEGSTLISERNSMALNVVRQQLAKGKKKLAIYYGAAHMADFAASLKSDFGMVPVETRWLDAWNLS